MKKIVVVLGSIGVAGVALVAAVAIAALLFLRGAGSLQPPKGSLQEGGPVVPLNWSVHDGDGKSINVADFAGDVIVVNFWATWCPPCRMEKPAWAKVHADYADTRGIHFLFITDEDTTTVKKYLADHGLDLPIAYATDEIPRILQPADGIPTTWLIAPDGRIAYKQVGAADWSMPQGHILIGRLLSQRADP